VNRRYILLALALVLTVFVFDYYFLRPQSELLRERVAAGYAMLQKDEQYLKVSAATGEDISAVSEQVEKMEKRLIPERSEFLAAARLQGKVSDLAGKAGLKVMTIRPLEAARVNHYRIISIYFEGSSSIREIGEFLRSLESDALTIRIEKLGLNVTNMQNPKNLKFKIQVSGLAKI
jgi:hypothetical protein